MAVKKLNIPSQVSGVLKTIESEGCRAYIVGQCVSELLRGGTPMDYDIITNADFEEMQYIFRDTRIVSRDRRMSSVMVSVLGMVIQVSSYKSGIENGTAVYTDNYLFDLAGRDFSVNAIAYHPRRGFKDPFDGMECINGDTITLKAIGEYPVKLWKENDLDENELTLKLEPQSCFVTNPANILNALIFLGGEDYTIDKVTADAVNRNAELLKTLPPDELLSLFTKLLLTRNISKVMTEFTDVFLTVVPELRKCTEFEPKTGGCSLWEHIARSVEFSPPYADMRYAMLFHNSGKPDCYSEDGTAEYYYGHAERGRILAGLFFDNFKAEKRLRDSTDFLIEHHDTVIRDDRAYLKQLLSDFEADELKRLIKLRTADDMAMPLVHDGKIAEYRRAVQTLDDIIASGECYRMSQLAVKENDLIRRGFASNSRQAQQIMKYLFDAVLQQPKLNSAPVLLELVKKAIKK